MGGDLAWTVVPAPSPVHGLTLGVTGAGLVSVAWGEDPDVPQAAARRLGLEVRHEPDADGLTARAASVVRDYLAGEGRTFDVPIDWRLTGGTARTVLQALYAHVGYGKTVGYAELAELSGAYPGHGYTAARGVGSVMGSNPIPVVVPCHRVLASDGLGGFGGGRPVKEWLLALEGVLPPTLDFTTA
ncbi:methylated-DNA--[protein]-cysteine S-methyltransferase [Pseudonocardia endophytica]|uniref:Methylated-DNA--protein-cysteine methyltransferase n=1 Tax=Pseudonocardia endophytica TaxID=401976 RepID=A0A4R1HXD6_PSEEN|nr:methylated-DNA--[protein]-cysteine S-methyltransferase [Pseudonocardia endophytica]TCK27444.1 methylated-DNA-[protein]-cysteine S-methyltransferase [Pseudonocardia endophytica]